VIATDEREAAPARTRWDQWQGRYERGSRRRSRQARIIAGVIFAAILANLLVQLWVRYA
jgi:hypothetical protein